MPGVVIRNNRIPWFSRYPYLMRETGPWKINHKIILKVYYRNGYKAREKRISPHERGSRFLSKIPYSKKDLCSSDKLQKLVRGLYHWNKLLGINRYTCIFTHVVSISTVTIWKRKISRLDKKNVSRQRWVAIILHAHNLGCLGKGWSAATGDSWQRG